MRIVAALLFVLISPAAHGQDPRDGIPREGAAPETLRVGTKEAVPFVMRDGDEWEGISIDLWKELAEEMGLEYEFVETDLEGLITGLERGALDLSIAAITTTPEREERIDFSQPYYQSGLGIAVERGPGGWVPMARKILSPPFLKTLAILLITLFVVGAIIWAVERRRNDDFGGKPAEGIWSGFWWSAVTMTTVGYGDKAPITVIGRVVALVWMFVGLVAISSLTAAMTSALTLSQLGSDVRGPSDLANVNVGTVAASTSAEYLERRGIGFEDYPDLKSALEDLSQGELEAVVYDLPILTWVTREDFDDLTTVPAVFDRQSYGIAFPDGSPLKELVDQRLLDVIRDEEWRLIRTRYLGQREEEE